MKKSYKTERPVNSAAISPLKPHVSGIPLTLRLDHFPWAHLIFSPQSYPQVILGGGQEAMDVTTTSTRVGKFDARLFNLIFAEEFGRIKGHFGPINTVAFHPDGKG